MNKNYFNSIKGLKDFCIDDYGNFFYSINKGINNATTANCIHKNNRFFSNVYIGSSCIIITEEEYD